MQNLKKPELLCPVGGKKQLIAAVENGADAVYLGGLEFNARIYADNFESISSVEEAVDYAHLRNVKVYVTLNTLLNDNEFEAAVEYATQLYKIGVDALIIQDIGLIDMISKKLPDFKIHISTQATVYSKEGVNYFDKYPSVERVVLARELGLNEIEEIIKNTNKEIEVFVHGALCVCYSGQCKLSSQIGSRSGNRGKCAQPCRLPYKIVDEKTNTILKESYYLSTKDICTIDILPELINVGIDSLKIEGRMKSPEYVAAVTKIYRKYIDKCAERGKYFVDEVDRKVLLQVFNRGNFTKGYFLNKDSKNIWCSLKPKHLGTYLGKVIEYNKKKNNIDIKLEQDLSIGDVIEVSNKELSSAMISFIRSKKERVKLAKKGYKVTLGDIKGDIVKGQEVYKITSKILNDELSTSFNGKSIKKNDLDIIVNLNIDEIPSITLSTNIFGKEYKIALKEGEKCEKGITKVLTKEEVERQLAKTGDVPFKLNQVEVKLQDGVMTSLSNLNNLRRQAIDNLSSKIVNDFKKKFIYKESKESSRSKKIENINRETRLSIYVYKIDNIQKLDILNCANRVYISLEDLVKYKEKILKNINREKICIYLPTITSNKYKKYIDENIEIIKDIKNILVTNIEHLEMFKKLGLNIYIDNSFNVFNSNTFNNISENNIKGINLSNELTLEQINNIRITKDTEIEVDIYGNQQVMYSNLCMLNAAGNCGICSGKYKLIDRKEEEFPVIFNNIQCTMQVLNSNKLFSEEAINELNGKVDNMRLYIYDESSEELKTIIDTINCILNKNKISNKIISNDNVKYTNGHFFREV